MYNVLICDDQPDIVNALKIYLAPEGYNLYEAFNGREALRFVYVCVKSDNGYNRCNNNKCGEQCHKNSKAL